MTRSVPQPTSEPTPPQASQHRPPTQWAVIINLSPDSFSGDGAGHPGSQRDAVACRLESLVHAPVDWIDVGAVSTRPGSHPVTVDEEWRRLSAAMEAIVAFRKRRHAMGRPVCISLDTSSPLNALRAASQGCVDIINDVWGGRKREDGLSTIDVAAQWGCGLILMHMQGEPGTMQTQPKYNNCIDEVTSFLSAQWSRARAAGVSQIYVDPGIGFGKTLQHNLSLLSPEGLRSLCGIARSRFEIPKIVIGLSRKRFLLDLAFGLEAEHGQHVDHREHVVSDNDLRIPANRDYATKVWEQRCIDRFESLDKDGLPSVLVVRTHRLPHEVTGTLRH